MGVLQPMCYLNSLALKAARNLLGRTFYATQEYPSKGVIFWRRQPSQLPCIAVLVSGHQLVHNCIWCYSHHLVGMVLAGLIEIPWLGRWCRITFRVPHPPSGLWLCQVISCLVSLFSSRQEAAASLLCDVWPSWRESFVALLHCELSGIREGDRELFHIGIPPVTFLDLP